MIIRYTHSPLNIQNDHKILQMAIRKYTNVFQFKTLQNVPNWDDKMPSGSPA
jgi:hypothetical protein